jgi:Snf7
MHTTSSTLHCLSVFSFHPLTQAREDIADQKALADEIGNAIANNPAGEQIDEDELNEELGQLEQEQLDNQLLKTGTVPVLPSGPNAERKYSHRLR